MFQSDGQLSDVEKRGFGVLSCSPWAKCMRLKLEVTRPLLDMDTPWLCVEILGARNLESRQAVDAYCVVRVGGNAEAADGGDAAVDDKEETPHDDSTVGESDTEPTEWRSATAPSTSDPQWKFRVAMQLRDCRIQGDDAQLSVEIFNEKNFFFDMFPSNGGSRLSDEVVDHPKTSSLSDGEGTVPSRRRGRRRRLSTSDSGSMERPAAMFDFYGADEALGVADVNLALLARRASRGACATDEWHLLRGACSGEVRIRTLLLQTRPSTADLDALWDEKLHGNCGPLEDHYGFRIPPSSAREWTHLRSYQACREQRRVAEWEATFGSHFFSLASAKGSKVVKRLAREGIPRHWRQRVYLAMSGALEKQENAPAKNYYADLVRQIDARDSTAFRQIELDIDRTFGHSSTKMSTEEGRASLRRVLKAFSMHNPTVGYCQGLNFIVGFLLLLLDEESTFWLLIVICEDMFPGYYIPTMADTQTDMLVLKQLIAEELPRLAEFTADVGLPLELLGSQWLLCLFTTTFPSETVFRIFDCMMTEGPHFVFAVIMTHLRRLEAQLLEVDDFQAVLSVMKEAENTLFDADDFIREAVEEADHITADRVARLREEHSVSVHDEMQRADRARALNRQLAVVYQIPAFSSTAASLLRFFHEEAEMSSRSDVAFVLTLLCHGLVWLAEHSKRLRR